MEECEREKKLKAGKEKLAAFQKKKSKKKKRIKDADSIIPGIDVGEVSDVSSSSEISSGAEAQSNEDSDQQSLSGLSEDETPKDEGNLHSLLRLKAKLQSANQRIEELEECIMGKQLALDKVIVENEKLRKEVASQRVEKLEGFELKESEYVSQESKQGITSSESVNGDSNLNEEKGNLSDIQDLTQQVQWFQVQLKKAGMALQVQAEHQSLSVQALQEAKSEILNLQQNVTKKDQIISQLAEKLTQVSQQYSILQRAYDSLKDESKKDADSAFSATEVEMKLERLKLELEAEHKKSLNEMSNVLAEKKQELDSNQNENEELKKVCETSQMELKSQREEMEDKIAKLSEELMNVQSNNEKLRQHLESVNEENRALLDERDRTKVEKEEANLKIKFLEQQLIDSLNHMETDKLKLESVEIKLLSEKEEKVKVNIELQKYKEEVMTLKEEKEHANLKIQHFIEENASLKEEKEKANAERSLLQKQFEELKESLSSEFQSSTSQLNETLEQTSDMKSVNEELSGEVEKLKAERSGMLEQLDMYHSQVAEYESMISQMHGLQEENQALRMQNDELYNKINNQKDIIAGLKAELDVLSVDNKQLGEQLQIFTSDLSHHQSEIDIIETERHAFKEEMEHLQRHYVDLESETEVYKSSTASLSQQIAELKQELSISTTDSSSQLDTRSSADDYQIAESAQRKMMPLEECTITPSVVMMTREEIRESSELAQSYGNIIESAVLTTWTLDQDQSLESQYAIIEPQAQRVEEGRTVTDVSTFVTVHLDKTWEDESSSKELPDTPETSLALSKLAANQEDPGKSNLDQISMLADEIQKLYDILKTVSIPNLVSGSLANDRNTGARRDDSDGKIGSFVSSQDCFERKEDKDVSFRIERTDIEKVRFDSLKTGVQNLQKCLSSLNHDLEVIVSSSPRCSLGDEEEGDPMPCDSPKQMTVTSLDDIGVKVSSSNLQVEMSYQEKLKHASSPLIACCQGDVDLGLSDFAFVLPTAVDACIQIEDSRQKLHVGDSEMETSQGSKNSLSERGVESRQSLISEMKSPFEGEVEPEQNVSRQEIESLNIEIGRLQEVLKVCLTEKADLLELVETERHRAYTAEEALQRLDEQCQKCSKDLENRITSKQQLQTEFDSMRSKLSEFETSLSQISIENEVLVSERDKLADQNEELKNVSDNLKSDILELENKLSEMSDENKTLQSVGDKLLEQSLILSESMNDKVEMEANIGELEQTLGSLQQALDNLEQEKEYLKEELGRKEQIEEKIEDLAGTVSEFQEHRAKLEMENELLRQERQKFQLMALDVVRTHEELKEDRRCLVERLEALVEEKEKLQSHVCQKTNLSSELQGELNELRIENDSLKTKVKAVEFITNEKEKLSEELHDLKKMCQELNEKISDLTAEKENLITKYESEMDGLLQESSTLKTKEMSLQDEIQELHRKIQENDHQLKEKLDLMQEQEGEIHSSEDELKKKLDWLQMENDGMKSKVEAFECIKDESERFSQELHGLKITCQGLEQKITDLTAEKETLILKYESEMDGLMQESCTLKTKESSLQDEVQELLQKLKEKDHLTENLDLAQQQGSKVQNLHKKSNAARVVIQCIKKDVKNLIRQVRGDDSELVDTDEIKSQVFEEDNVLISVTNESASLLEKELNELQLEVEQLKLEINDAQNRELEDHKNMRENGGKRYSDTKRELRASDDSDKESLLSQLELEKKYKAKMQKDLENLQKDYEILQRKFAQVQEDLERYHRHLRSVEEERNELEDLTLQLQEDMKLALVDRDNVHQEFETLEMEYNTLDQQKHGLVEEIETLQMHLNAVSENRNHVRTQVEILAAELDTVSKSRDDFAIKYCVVDKENQRLRAENGQNLYYFGIIQEKVSQFEKVLDEKYGLEGENQTLTQRIESLNDRVDSLEKEKESLSRLTQRLTNTLGEMQTKYEEIKSDMETTKKNCDREIEKLKHQLKQVNDSVHELKSTLEFFENELCDTNDERICLKENLERQTAEIQEVIEEKQRLQELNEKYQKDLKNKKIVIDQQNQRISSHMGSHDQVSDLTTHDMGVQTETILMAGEFYEDMPSVFARVSTGFQTDISCIMKKVFSVNLNQTEGRLETLDSERNESERVHPNSPDFATNISSSLFFDSGIHVILERGISHEIPTEDPMDPHFESDITQNILSICDSGDSMKEGENKLLVSRALAENDQMGNVDELRNITEDVEEETNKAVPQRQILQSYEISRDYNYHCVLDSLTVKDWCEKSAQTENCETCDSAAQTDYNLSAIFTDCNILCHDKETLTHQTTVNRSVQTYSRLLSCSFEVLANVDIDGLESTSASQSTVQDNCMQTDKIPSNYSLVQLDSIDIFFEGSELEKQTKWIDFSTQTEDSITFRSESVVSDICYKVPFEDSKERIEKTGSYDLQGSNVHVASEEMTETDNILVHPTEVEEPCQEEKQQMQNQDEQVEEMAQKNFELELSMMKERYELQMKQKEYEFEEKFAMEFRSKQVELMHQMDLEKKEIMKNMELVVKRRVEKVKKEKEKVFVETMRKVRADLKEKHERKLEELHQKMLSGIPSRSEMVGSPRQADDDDTIQRLHKENQQLAKARDALMQQLDLSEQKQKQLQDDLQNLLSDEEWLELDDDGLEMEMENEFGFGEGGVLDWKIPSSLLQRLSQDLTSAAGGQDNCVSHAGKPFDSTQCSRPECQALQEKYIKIRRKLQNLGRSFSPRGSLERDDVFSEKKQTCIIQDIRISAENPDDKDIEDKFISDEDQDAQLLQRLTSIHLEHSVRTPNPTSVPLDNENKFIFDDEDSVSVSHSKEEECIGKGRSEGHFSEQNSEDEKAEDGHSVRKEGYFSEQESDEEDLMPAHLSHENSPLHTSSGSSVSQNAKWIHGTDFSIVGDEESQFYEMSGPSTYKEYHERTPISDDETEVSLSSTEKKTTSSGESNLPSKQYGKEGAFIANADQVLENHATHGLKLPRRTKSESSDDTNANQRQSEDSIASYNEIPRSMSLSFVAQEREQYLAFLPDSQNRFVSELSPQIENLPLQEELESDSVYLDESDIIQSDSGFVQESSDMTFRSGSDYVRESSDESVSFGKEFDTGTSLQYYMVKPDKDRSPSRLLRQSDSNNSKENGTISKGPITISKSSDMQLGKDCFVVERVDLGGVLESVIGQEAFISSASANILETSGGDDVMHRETDDYKSLRKLCEELKLQIDILKEEKDSLEIKVLLHEELDSEMKILKEEKEYMENKIREQMEHFGKEKQEFMSRCSLLVAEMESLSLSKDELEDKLRKQQEEFEQYVIKLEETRSEESLRESNQEIQELKLKVLDLEKDIREKDAYVRKLEEHFLNQERGLPSKGSTASLGSPGIGKVISSERMVLETRRSSLSLSIGKVEQNKREIVREPSESFCPMEQSESLSLDGDFVDAMYKTEYRHFQNSSHLHQTPIDSHFIEGDGEFSLPFPDEPEPPDYIRLGLDQSIDGHVAMEQKHFELLEEISHLKRDFRETKAIYSKEIILLQTALEQERCLREGLQSKPEHQDMNYQDILSSDVVHLRQKVSVLNETNKLLSIENDRWMLRIKEQEAVVMELREKLCYKKGGIDEVEEVFGKQLALLQKQREELLEQLRKREHDNGKLSQLLGEKAVLEDTLKKEKAIISKKLQEKAEVETQLHEKELELVRQKQELKRLEELMYQKDLTERELMRQKRLLEEELREIEAKFRDREEHLGIEKNKLLDELRHNRLGVRSRNRHSEGDLDNVSVASDSSSISTRSVVSEIEFGRLELMLEEVGRQHSNAVEVLRDKLSSKHKRKERAILQKHVSILQSNGQRSEESEC